MLIWVTQDIMLNFLGGEKEKKHMIAHPKRLGYRVGDVSGYPRSVTLTLNLLKVTHPQIHSKDVDGKLGKMKAPRYVQKDRSLEN